MPDAPQHRLMPAPGRFTADRRARLLGMLEAGSTVQDAAARVGVDRSTPDRWVARGRREHGTEAAEFAVEFDRARQAHDERPLMAADLIRLLERSALRGSIRATQLLLEWPWEQKRPGKPKRDRDPFDELDAVRRRRRPRGSA